MLEESSGFILILNLKSFKHVNSNLNFIPSYAAVVQGCIGEGGQGGTGSGRRKVFDDLLFCACQLPLVT